MFGEEIKLNKKSPFKLPKEKAHPNLPKGKAANHKARFATPPFFSNPPEKAVLFDLSPPYGGQGAIPGIPLSV